VPVFLHVAEVPQAAVRLGRASSISLHLRSEFEELPKINVPTLVLHGKDDRIVPVKDSARKTAKLINGAIEKYYPGLPRHHRHPPGPGEC
jgi:pimeloyl-ACP methyl ester carboxylesterase